MTKFLKISIALCVFTLSFNAFSKTGKEVMKEVYDLEKKYKTVKKTVKLVIINKDKDKKVRYFDTISKKLKKKKNTLIRFYRPKDIKGTALLTERRDNEADPVQWFYFPFLRQVKKLSASERNNSFMGSDFTYDDIAGRKLEQDKYKLIKTTKKYYFIRAFPKSSKSAYHHMDMVISRKLKLVIKIQFFDKYEEKTKMLVNKKIKKINGINTVTYSVMTNQVTKGKSKFVIKDIEYNIAISDTDVGIKGLTK
jgi:hypothetical protein